MNKLAGIINSMNYKELQLLEKDLYEGNLANLVKKRKQVYGSLMESKACPTCGNENKENEAQFTLIFGPKDFKKKASFCGRDCLCFFVKKIKMNDETVKNF